MRRYSAVALLLVVLGTSSAQASWFDGPAPGFTREKIVKLIKKFVGIVRGDGDQMSVPKP